MAGWGPSLIVPPGFGQNNGSTTSTSSASGLIGSTGPSIPSIPTPTLTPFNYSTDSQSYPTYLRNLGENTAQKNFQQSTNRISAGNSAQNLMHAQDALMNNRLNYMSQAGQQQLGVDNSMADNWNKYNALLAQLFGTQVQQRGQDVGYAGQLGSAQLSNINYGQPMVLGGGNSQGAAPQGTFTNIYGQKTVGGSGASNSTDSIGAGTRAYYDRGYF